MAYFSWQEDNRDIVTSGDGRDVLGVLLSFDIFKWVDHLADYWGISRTLFMSILFCGLLGVISDEVPNLATYTIEWLIGTSPVWLPIGLAIGAWKVWVWYARSLFLSKQKGVLLEMKVPREVSRSPRAMELALTMLWTNAGETTFYLRIWKGQTRPFYSLEVASFGGHVRFFVWCRDRDKNVIESMLYAYYPEIELHEVEDYSMKYEYDPDKYMVFCTGWRYEPRSDAFPIKTYIDFELDKDPKEEFKIDPLAEIFEFMSNLKPQEQIWMQIIFTLNKDKRHKKGSLYESEARWVSLIKEEVAKIRKDAALNPGKEHAPETDERKYGFPRPTWSQTEQIMTMERNMGKLPFSVGMRGVYIAEKKYFHGPNYNALRWIWRPIGNPLYLNQLRPRRGHNSYDWPWQDYRGFRWNLEARRFFDAYRRRSFFYPPWITPHMMMSTEVLATLWHPPSRSITAPGIQRMPATKAEPPANLPR